MRLVLFLLFLLFFYILYRLFRAVPNPQGEAHDMIPCFRCGTYVSKSAAHSGLAKSFCSEKCRNESSTIVS